MTAKKTDGEKLRAAEATTGRLAAENSRVEIERLKVVIAGMGLKADVQAKEIATLKDELREAVEEADVVSRAAKDVGLLNQAQAQRLRESNDHLRRIRRGLIRTWGHNDLLCEQLTGSHQMPDGRLFRDHTRDEFLRASFEYTSAAAVTCGTEGPTSTTG